MQKFSKILPSFGIQVAIGMVAGVGLGLIAAEAGGADGAIGTTLHTIGQIFVQLGTPNNPGVNWPEMIHCA